jgi:DnaA family protein
VTGQASWDRALFRLLDLMSAEPGALLMAARAPPQQLRFTLPDLASRAAAAAVYRLQPLDDTARARALRAHATARGLALDARALRYLIERSDSDMAALCRWLDVLDARSLAMQRRVTLPFIREVLATARADGAASSE